MAKKIVYIHPGDMIEVRFCSLDYDTTAAEWKEQLRPRHETIRFDKNGDLEVFDAIRVSVYSGTGENRIQMFEAKRG